MVRTGTDLGRSPTNVYALVAHLRRIMATPAGRTLDKVRDAHRSFGRAPAIVPSGATIRRAVEECLRHPDTASVYVVDARGTLVGVVRLCDLLRTEPARSVTNRGDVASLARSWNKHLSTQQVDGAMHPPTSVREDDLLIDAWEKMVALQLSDLPVVDRDQRLVGELNAPDLLKFLLEDVRSGASGGDLIPPVP